MSIICFLQRLTRLLTQQISNEYIEETEMESTLNFANTAQDWLEKLEQLVLARGHDKQDNYSAIAVMCKE